MSELLPRMTDAELEQALLELGRHLDYPAADLASVVSQRISAPAAERARWGAVLRTAQAWLARPVEPPRWAPRWVTPLRRSLVLAIVAAVLVAAVGVAVGLGLPGIRIVLVPGPSAVPSAVPSGSPVASSTALPVEALGLGDRVSLEQARAGVEFPVLVPAVPELGEPDETYLGTLPSGRQVALVYRPGPELPATGSADVGLLLIEFEGTIDPDLFLKILTPQTSLEPVTVNGRRAYWIAGQPHELLYRARSGEVIVERVRLAGNVLIWQQGDLTLRLESGLDLDSAIRIAESAG